MQILRYPDPRLRLVALPVRRIDAQVRRSVADMFGVMYARNGIGLAATQVGIRRQIAVVDLSRERNRQLVLINARLLWRSERLLRTCEGCLSLPGRWGWTRRPEQIRLTALDLEGRDFRLEAEGLLAVCIQHELDHLRGRLFIDRPSPADGGGR